MGDKPLRLADIDAQLKDNEDFVLCEDDTDREAVRILRRLWEGLRAELAPVDGKHELTLEKDPESGAESRPVGKYLTRHKAGSPISYTFVVKLRIPGYGFTSTTTLDIVAHPSNARDAVKGPLSDWKFTSKRTGIHDLGLGVANAQAVTNAAKIAATMVCIDALEKAKASGNAQPS